jgi:predicted nucleic acid-binding protein
VIALLEAIATPVLVTFKERPLLLDPNDDMVLDVAINGDADAIVTNNMKDIAPVAERFGIQAQTPREFLIAIKKGDSNNANKPEKERNQ